MYLYSVYDVVAELWAPPFMQENDRSALRSFEQLKAQNPSAAPDVKLYRLGTYDKKAVLSGYGPMVSTGADEVTSASVMKELENA